MALLRRAPREVYRVFSESDFLAGGAADEQWEPVTSETVGRRRLHRMGGAAMLAGAVAAVGAVLVLRRPQPQAPVRSIVSRPSPVSVGEARAARAGSASDAARVSEHVRSTRRAVATARGRTATATSSRGHSSGGSMPAPAVNPVAGAVSSAQLERAEFGFER